MTNLFHKLTARHRRLDDEISAEHRRPAPNSLKLLRLKRLRLAVKDRLNRLFRQPLTA